MLTYPRENPTQCILVVEDDPDAIKLLKRGLNSQGFETMVAWFGHQVLTIMHHFSPDLVLLSVDLPDLDGQEICRRLRSSGDYTPILLLSPKDEVAERIAGLESGADDYIIKPFAFAELLARIHAVLRRGAEKVRPARTIEVADLRIEPASRQVWRGGNLLELTKCEYNLLELLARHAGQVLTTGTIFQCIWGDNPGIGQEVVKVYIHALRKKLNRDGQANLIDTRRGVGYVLCRHSLPLDKCLM